jgi:signal transduction histidine kinase/DNA-binding response OmpR family regulator
VPRQGRISSAVIVMRPASGTSRQRPPVRWLLLGIVLACLVPGLVGAAALVYRIVMNDRAQTEVNTLRTARGLSQTLDAELARAKAVALALATSSQLAANDLVGFHRRAQDLLQTEGIGHNIILSDATGHQVLNTLVPAGYALLAHGDPSLATRSFDAPRPLVSDLFTSTTAGQPIVTVDVPVLLAGQVAYGLSLVLAPQDFENILKKSKLPAGWIASISDRNGTTVARTSLQERFVGAKVNPELLKRLQLASEGVYESNTREGIPAALAFSRSSASGWTVALAVPRQALAASWLSTLSLIGLGAAALFGIGGLFAWRQGGKVARSVEALQQAATAMAEGRAAPVTALHFAEAQRANEAITTSVAMLADRAKTQALTHAALTESQARLAEAQSLARLGSWYWDAASESVEVSASLQSVFGRDEMHPFCKQGATAYLPESCDRLNAATHHLQKTGLGFSLVLSGRHADGSSMSVDARAEAVRSESGTLLGIRGTVQDITARIQVEEVRASAVRLDLENRQIREASRIKNQFLANMSHELRTPLNAIIGFAELLQIGAVDADKAKRERFLGHIGTSGRHLLQLINDVLDLSKVESGKFEFFPEPLDLRLLMKECGDVLHSLVLRQKIRLAVEVDPTLTDLVLDPSRLKQVMYNYLSNAIKFSPLGGLVQVRATGEGPTRFRIEVEDFGIGIAEADLPRLFNDFEQLNAGYAKQHAGTGLGLALTRRLVQAQGGQVGVRSHLGQGSVFYLVLDRVCVKQADAADALALATAERPLPRLLVIDSQDKSRAQLVRRLTDAGFLTDDASTPDQATRRAHDKAYDGITLDLRMPAGGGLAVLASIRGQDGSASRLTPVVSMSMPDHQGAATTFAVANVLSKPICVDEIVAALTRYRAASPGRCTVMVVDDDAAALGLMREAIEALDIQALCLQDGQQALRDMDRHKPNAIILDLMMPDFNGFEFIDALQRLPGWWDTPVFIWTAMNLAADDYVRLWRSTQLIASKGGGAWQPVLASLNARYAGATDLAKEGVAA